MWHSPCLETFVSRNDREHLSAIFLGSGRTPKDSRLLLEQTVSTNQLGDQLPKGDHF